MAERHARSPESPEAGGEPVVAEMTSRPTHKQEHIVAQGSHVTLHGGHFSVKDNEYRWHMRDPKGDDIPLLNAQGAEPSFIATEVGEYTARLTTTEGHVDITIHVVA